MDNQSIQHTRWNCTYHIVFIPKYRRKVMYGEVKRDVVEVKKLCEMKQVQILEGKVCKDHVHMYVAIPPKMSVSDFMSYLKGKSALMLFDRQTSRVSSKTRRSAFLGKRILRYNSRQCERGNDSGIYSKPGRK